MHVPAETISGRQSCGGGAVLEAAVPPARANEMKDFGFLTLAALSDGDRSQAIASADLNGHFRELPGRSQRLPQESQAKHTHQGDARPLAARPRTC